MCNLCVNLSELDSIKYSIGNYVLIVMNFMYKVIKFNYNVINHLNFNYENVDNFKAIKLQIH